jgi:hypothetical protein
MIKWTEEGATRERSESKLAIRNAVSKVCKSIYYPLPWERVTLPQMVLNLVPLISFLALRHARRTNMRVRSQWCTVGPGIVTQTRKRAPQIPGAFSRSQVTALPSICQSHSDASRVLSVVVGSKTCRQHKSAAFL